MEEASMMSARVRDVMTTQVVAVRTSASFKEMAATLRDRRVSAFPVLDDGGKVIGVVSEADLIAKEALETSYDAQPGRLAGLLHRHEQEKAQGVTAADLMTSPAITVGPDALVSHAAHLMYERRVKRLPVVDDEGRLAGIISRTDVLGVFGRPDAEIRQEILDRVFVGEFLSDPASFTVTVSDGVVTLEGHPETTAVGQGIVRAVRHVEGVVAVRDRLSYPPARTAPVSVPLF